jgi:hypothetical protein
MRGRVVAGAAAAEVLRQMARRRGNNSPIAFCLLDLTGGLPYIGPLRALPR